MPQASCESNIRRAQIDLLSLGEGFFESQILFALNKLRVFDLLGKDEKPLEEIAEGVGARAPEEGARPSTTRGRLGP